MLIFILLFIGFIGGSVLYVDSALKPVDEKENKKIDVLIPIGSSVIEIAELLEKKGAIKSALVFRYYVKLKTKQVFKQGTMC